MQEYSRQFTGEYPPELRREPGLTESTELQEKPNKQKNECNAFTSNRCIFSTLGPESDKQIKLVKNKIPFDLKLSKDVSGAPPI